MAVKSVKVASSLKLTVKAGIDSKGKDKLATKTLSNIKVTAVDEDVLAVGEAISKVKRYPVLGIDRDDQYSLVRE